MDKFKMKEFDKLYNEPIQIPVITNLLRLIKWSIWDIVDGIKNKKKPHLYGIYGFFGLPGEGKTMALTKELLDLRKKYGDQIYIFTNYGFKYEDKPFSNWRMLLEKYDRPTVFAWDEVQNEFNSRDFKNFPVELLTLLTQNRKGHGKRIYYTAQRFGRVDKVFRELTAECGQCKTYFKRHTRVKWYKWDSYEAMLTKADPEQKLKIKPIRRTTLTQTNFIRNCYNSFKMLESAKDKVEKNQYMDRTEVISLL